MNFQFLMLYLLSPLVDQIDGQDDSIVQPQSGAHEKQQNRSTDHCNHKPNTGMDENGSELFAYFFIEINVDVHGYVLAWMVINLFGLLHTRM